MRRMLALLCVFMLAPVAAKADTLYQSGPPPAGPGHPLRLGPDHRAAQVGDLVYVLFDFNDTNTHTNNYSSNKQFALTQAAGTGNLGLPLLRNASGLSGQSTTSTAQSASGADAFVSTMMATVTAVMPSGALVISGDQGISINGRKQLLNITGTIRPEDVDSTDTVVASRVANVQATFKGDDQKNKGLLARILSWLF